MKKVGAIPFLVLSFQAVAQSIMGICCNEASQPISFVTILNQRTRSSSYSDEDGKFSIVLKLVSPEDTILLSHIGYEEIRMTVAQIEALKSPIALKPINYGLREVVVKPSDAKEIFMDARSHIGSNYPADFSMNHIVYKDFFRVNDSAWLYYNFDCNVYLPSYLAKDSPRVYTTDIRHEMFTKGGRPLPGSPRKLLTEMYPENILDLKGIDEKGFTILSTSTMIDSEEYSVIRFRTKPIKFAKQMIGEGTIYINNADRGIRFVETHGYIDHPGRFLLLVKLDSMDVNQKIAFKKIDGKYVLDYMTSSSFSKTRMLGLHMNIFQAMTIRVAGRKMELQMDEIKMKTEVDDIISKEKPKDIKELKGNPDIH